MVMGIIAAVALAFVAGVFVGGIMINKDSYDDAEEEPLGRWAWNKFIVCFKPIQKLLGGNKNGKSNQNS